MKLNLGSGLFPFPYVRGHIPNEGHVMPLPETVFEDGWVNVDKVQSPGVQERINLFKFPWVRSSNGNPFNDSSVDFIYAAHIVEHVPHAVRLYDGLPGALSARYGKMVEDLDGFFCFFAECWRILKPDGLIHIRFPYATSYPSLNDPTHTRYLTPGSFSYLGASDENTPFDYQVPCHFELDGVYDFRITPSWAEETKKFTPDHVVALMRENYAIADECRMTLRAVKDGGAP